MVKQREQGGFEIKDENSNAEGMQQQWNSKIERALKKNKNTTRRTPTQQ
jgi:uncharacterized protein YjbJ (UPF0337 family)